MNLCDANVRVRCQSLLSDKRDVFLGPLQQLRYRFLDTEGGGLIASASESGQGRVGVCPGAARRSRMPFSIGSAPRQQANKVEKVSSAKTKAAHILAAESRSDGDGTVSVVGAFAVALVFSTLLFNIRLSVLGTLAYLSD